MGVELQQVPLSVLYNREIKDKKGITCCPQCVAYMKVGPPERERRQ